jgi:hypothetical protein
VLPRKEKMKQDRLGRESEADDEPSQAISGVKWYKVEKKVLTVPHLKKREFKVDLISLIAFNQHVGGFKQRRRTTGDNT